MSPARAVAPSVWAVAACELLAVVLLLPLIRAAVSSFSAGAGSGFAHWWGAPRGWDAMGQSLCLAAAAASLAVPLGWALAAAAGRGPKRLGVAVAVLSCLPMLLPSSLLGTAWLAGLGCEAVPAAALQAMGLPFDLSRLPVAAAALALRYFGIATAVLVVRRCLRTGRPGPAASSSRRGRLCALAAAWLVVAALSMNDAVLPEVLRLPTFNTQATVQIQAYLDAPGAAALSLPFALVEIALLTAAVLLLSPRHARFRDAGPERPPDAGASLSSTPARTTSAVCMSVAILAIPLAGPPAVLACRAGSPAALGSALAGANQEITRTLTLAAIAGPLAALTGLALGRYWARRPRSLVPAVLLNLVVPAPLLAVGLVELMQRWPLTALQYSPAAPAIAWAFRFVPLSTLAFFALARHNAPGLSTGRARWLALLAVGVLCFLLAVGDVQLSALLDVPGETTLAVRLYKMVHEAPPWLFSALSLDVLAFYAPATVALLPPAVILLTSGRARSLRRRRSCKMSAR